MRFYLMIYGKAIRGIENNPLSENINMLRTVDCYSFPSSQVGTELIKEFEIKNPDELANTIEYIADSYYRVDLEYDVIKDFPNNLFKDGYKIEINVPKNFLNKFFEIQFDERNDKFIREFNVETFLKFWVKSDFKISFIDEALLKSNQVATNIIYFENQLKEQRKRADLEYKKAEKKVWISSYGSEYLKNCFDNGHENLKQYVIERAGVEFPDFISEYPYLPCFKKTEAPTKKALDELLKYKKIHKNFEFTIELKQEKEVLVLYNYYEGAKLYKFI